MSHKRLSDTAVLASRPIKGEAKGCTYKSISVRPIDNGFVVSETTERDGDYKSTERYMPEAPKLEANYGDKSASSSMSEAKKYLGS